MTCIVCGGIFDVFIPKISDDRYGEKGVYSINKCRKCGLLSCQPPLADEDLPRLYSTYYPRKSVKYDSIASESKKVSGLFASISRWLKGTDNQGHYLARPGNKVLDIGCGSCLSLLELRELGAYAWGLEADPNVTDIAEHFNLEVHIGSLFDHPFDGEKFDLITLNQVIEHMPDPKRALETLHSYLAPEGRVVLSFPNADSRYAKKYGKRWINWHVPYHQHHFTFSSFKYLADETGYEVLKSRTITPNLWTILQEDMVGEQLEAGQASSLWRIEKSISSNPRSLIRILRGIARRINILRRILIVTLVNRFYDWKFQGDSLLVELRPKR